MLVLIVLMVSVYTYIGLLLMVVSGDIGLNVVDSVSTTILVYVDDGVRITI